MTDAEKKYCQKIANGIIPNIKEPLYPAYAGCFNCKSRMVNEIVRFMYENHYISKLETNPDDSNGIN